MSQRSGPAAPGSRVAVFIDFENVKRAVDDFFAPERVDLRRILEEIANRTGGRILVKRAYADWGMFRDYRSDLLDNATEPVQTFALTQRGKNGADIRIAIDVMEFTLRQGDLTHVALVSGDSDFTPLVMKLREFGLQVIGVGVRSNTSTYFAKSCDTFLYYDELREGTAGKDRSGESDATDPGRLMMLALAELGNRTVTGSLLKSRMRQIDVRFDESRHGYDSFLGFLRAHEALIDLHKPAVGDVSVAPKGLLDAPHAALPNAAPTVTFRSSSYTPFPEPGGRYRNVLSDANFRYVPTRERLEVIDAMHFVFASAEGDISLKEAKDRVHAWFEENRPLVSWEAVNAAVYHLFYTWCFRFDKNDEGVGKQLWDRRTYLVDDVGSADDLRERVERGIVRKLWEECESIDPADLNDWLYDGNPETLSRVEELIALVSAPGATISSPRT
jgi:uncharacterized LabA/DUF88 family protein